MKELNLLKRGSRNVLSAQTEAAATWIVPVVMMLEGVHHGSRGAMLHTAAALEASAPLWDGKPVVIHHPQDETGNYISAYSEGVAHIGIITNSRWEEGKLKADLQIDSEALKEVSIKAWEAIKAGNPIDVSIGSYSEESNEAGEWNGEAYTGITANYDPDHLAILPGETGACSWNDGCGIRVNRKNNVEPNNETKMDLKEKLQVLVEAGVIMSPLQINAEGLRALMDKAYSLVNSMDSSMWYHWLEEVYEDHIVYKRSPRGENHNGREESLWRQNYTVDEAGNIALEGDPVKVTKKVDYIITNQEKKPIVKINKNKKEEKEMTTEQRVDKIIRNPLSGYSACDRDYLMSQTEEKLAEIEAKPSVIQANTVSAFLSTYTDPKEALKLFSESVQKSLSEGLAMYVEKRTKLVEEIQANTEANEWSKEELDGMTDPMLEKIHKTVMASKANPVNYAGAQAGAQVQANAAADDDDSPMKY